jgi:VanZ family protein
MLTARETKFAVLQVARVLAWSLAVAILVLSIVPPRFRPETDVPHHFEHLLIFLAAGITFGYGYGRRPFLLGLALVLFAGLVEVTQLFVPGRHARMSDFMVDAASLGVGVLLASLFGSRVLRNG